MVGKMFTIMTSEDVYHSLYTHNARPGNRSGSVLLRTLNLSVEALNNFSFYKLTVLMDAYPVNTTLDIYHYAVADLTKTVVQGDLDSYGFQFGKVCGVENDFILVKKRVCGVENVSSKVIMWEGFVLIRARTLRFNAESTKRHHDKYSGFGSDFTEAHDINSNDDVYFGSLLEES